jgi:transcription initiation factor TFIIIB Brf1 subunit/transcription initiation factor TFIIB
VSKPKEKRYTKNCPSCNAEQSYGRLDHYKSAVRGDWKCKKCGSVGINDKGKHHAIPVTWFNVKERGGRDRGYAWDLTIEYLWDMYLSQDKKCALSGVEIGWSERRLTPTASLTATASIDRIDNTEGYIKGNVQLVHKDVNFMKQQFDQEYFINMCKAIAENFTQ